jgi:hypothetical protein
MTAKLYIVHCVDTEGPLEEKLEATFERLRDQKQIDLAPSRDTLVRLQNRKIDLNGREAEIADFVAPKRLAYLSTWKEIEEMVTAMTSREYRLANADPAGNPYTFSWFIIDVVGYKDNPRRKAVGFHAVWDQYQRMLSGRLHNDCLGWHFHTVAVGNHALDYNTCWTNNDYHEQALARRIIQRRWFPSLFRAGGLIERNDLSYWLEQFIPFDYSVSSRKEAPDAPGSLLDWRFSPREWGGFHPGFHDYRRPGNMNRWLFRCLDIDSVNTTLSTEEVEKAFATVQAGKSTILAYSSHDRRDPRPEISLAVGLIRQVASRFPDVTWQWANAHEAARKSCRLLEIKPPCFSIHQKEHLLTIESDQPLFGPAPFLAIEEQGEIFYRDNPTVEAETRWAYRLVRPKTTLRVGVAGANSSGFVGLAVKNIADRKIVIERKNHGNFSSQDRPGD